MKPGQYKTPSGEIYTVTNTIGNFAVVRKDGVLCRVLQKNCKTWVLIA